METLCDQTSGVIIKFNGVLPGGVNRLHDAIDAVNKKSPFRKNDSSVPRVKLLKSEFSTQQAGYVMEIYVPFRTLAEDYGRDRGVPQSVITDLFDAVNEFQPE